MNGFVDLRLVLVLEPDALGIAATLDVENAVVSPAVLIVSDQGTLRVSGKGGLSRAGQSEKHGRAAVFPNIGRAVHGQYALFGQHIVHHTEHGLFQLAAVLVAGDQDLPGLQVDQDSRLAVNAVKLRDTLKARRGNERIVRTEVLQLLPGRTDEELMHKQILAGEFVDNAKTLRILGIGSGKAVKHKELTALQIGQDLGLQSPENLPAYGTVHTAPGNIIVGGGAVHIKFVVRAAAGVLPGMYRKGARIRQRPLTPCNGMLHKL